ncbi:complement factor H-like [Brienomyrus brachyistius]|uniref:complement factor H-like n=1 Tax=Brienomyrus brachyistius TaxID=42636 RepID=UPI0020B24580|nr:complement factor H-like [Brienomyrus brachyistius]
MPFFISFSAFHLFFIVSLCTYFTGVAAQTDCRKSAIPKLENAESRSDLKDQYSNKESERFPCKTGFVGFFRVTCRDGVWSKSGQCQAKQCGHPGDTLNGDFSLAVGDDFVFGSTVQYTCRKGYTMVSRISHRTCLSSGWDNNVPFCEVVKCEPLNPPEQLDVSGNFESPQYSDVVEFECNSAAEKLNGPRQIYCTDTGDWSGQMPTCQEITCTRPDIPNSIVDGKNVIYKNDEVIRFRCVENYDAVGSGIARCGKDGWTLSVRCEEFKCKVPDGQFLDFTSFPATEYTVGEVVNYTCLERYKKTEKFARCTRNNWRPQILCVEITCNNIPNSRSTKRVDEKWYHYRWTFTYGEHNYECNTRFRKTQPTANCTAHGWAPKNPCEEITCIKPQEVKLHDGETVFRLGKHGYSCVDGYRRTSNEAECTKNGLVKEHLCERECVMRPITNGYTVRAEHESALSYACDEGYKPKTGGWWDYITCTNEKWSDTPECIDKNLCRDLPEIANGRSKETKQEYRHGETVKIECDAGYSAKCTSRSPKVPACKAGEGCNNTMAADKSDKGAGSDDCALAKCINGEWQLPQCIKCVLPPLTNGYTVRAEHESALSYACDEGYKPKTGGWWDYITCTNEKWSDTPKCIANNSCRVLPAVFHAGIHKDEYSDGATVEIQCYLGSTSKCINVKLECTDNCTRIDEERKGSKDEDIKRNACEAECQTHYSAKCKDGEWTFPLCYDKVNDLPCDMVPDRQLENKRNEEGIATQTK